MGATLMKLFLFHFVAFSLIVDNAFAATTRHYKFEVSLLVKVLFTFLCLIFS